MFKFGTVTDLDFKKAQAKVTFPDEHGRDGGEKFSVWLTVLMWRTKDVSMYSMPVKGALVACMLDDSWETGVILGEAYTKKNKPKSSMKKNRTVAIFPDGTEVRYDSATSELLIDAAKDVTVKSATGTVKIDAMTVQIKATTANIEATTAKIEAATATIKASAGTASLLDTLTGLPFHTFVPAP